MLNVLCTFRVLNFYTPYTLGQIGFSGRYSEAMQTSCFFWLILAFFGGSTLQPAWSFCFSVCGVCFLGGDLFSGYLFVFLTRRLMSFLAVGILHAGMKPVPGLLGEGPPSAACTGTEITEHQGSPLAGSPMPLGQHPETMLL